MIEILGIILYGLIFLGCFYYNMFCGSSPLDGLPLPEGKTPVKVEAAVSLSRAEIYALLDSVPESQEVLSTKLREALTHVERELPVYGGGCTIRPEGD